MLIGRNILCSIVQLHPLNHPNSMPLLILVLSCLWGLDGFLQAGLTLIDLIPVKQILDAAKSEMILISGAILLRLSGFSSSSQQYNAAVMVYVSPSARKFYLSEETLTQLGIILPAQNSKIPIHRLRVPFINLPYRAIYFTIVIILDG